MHTGKRKGYLTLIWPSFDLICQSSDGILMIEIKNRHQLVLYKYALIYSPLLLYTYAVRNNPTSQTSYLFAILFNIIPSMYCSILSRIFSSKNLFKCRCTPCTYSFQGRVLMLQTRCCWKKSWENWNQLWTDYGS